MTTINPPRLLVGCLVVLGCSHASPPSLDGFVKLDDMEGNSDGVIAWVPPDGLLPGAWSTATDCTEAEQISPRPDYAPDGGWTYAELDEPTQTFPGVVSTHAARLRTTSPLMNVWGANMGFDLAAPPGPDGGRILPPPYSPDAGVPAVGAGCVQVSNLRTKAMPVDLRAYAGLTLWAMSRSGERRLYVQLADDNVDPRAGNCNAANPDDESKCYNHFRKLLTLSETMTRYTVDFAELQQDPTWGYRPDPDVPNLQRVYQLTFEVDEEHCGLDSNAMCAGGTTPPLSLDVWVDDIYLVKP
jgi:hypothetical protein